MKISAPSRTRRGLGHRATEGLPRSGFERPRRRAPGRLFSAAIIGACLGLACSDDDPAGQTGVGGSSGSVEPDASVRDLPGDGREPTPDFDTESRQRTPIGPQRLVETIDQIRDDIGLDDDADAGPVSADPGDGGAN
jgi:hypothetical protein